MSFKSGRELLLTLVMFAPVLAAQVPRRPRGIYAKVNISSEINAQQQANLAITPAQLEAYFIGLYQGLLSNPAISGLLLQVHWDQVNPNPPTSANPYFWNYMDDAFNQAAAWNAHNSTQAPKTIQLVITPGFQSPQWLLNQIPSCDGLFETPSTAPPATCGKVTFATFGPEEIDGTVLPLPWNPVYKSAWRTFLTELAARYGSNSIFVSIAVAGPTAASEEMILPSNASAPAQAQFGGLLTNEMWLQLLKLQYSGMTTYQKSDQAFIDEWNAAIDMYGQVFSGVTLVATTGSGFPSFSTIGFTIPSTLAADCVNLTMDCAAEATILAHLADPTVGGANAKATQTSGMEASRGNNVDLGLVGVTLLSQSTAQLTSPSAQVLGGAQFNTSFSTNTLTEGCTSTFPPDASDTPVGCAIPSTCNVNGCVPVACIPQACLAPGVTAASLTSYKIYNDVPSADLIPPEQSEYNVLSVFFNGTAAASTFGGTPGTAPLNYLQIYAADVLYATANVKAPAQVVEAGGTIVMATAQDLLNLASQKLSATAEPPLLPAIASGGIVPGTIQPGEWVSIYGINLASETATWTGNFPTSLGGTSVTIGGKAAYLSFASYGQINLQAPSDSATGIVPVVITTASGTVRSTVTLAQFGPSFFLLDATHVAGIILRADGKGGYGGGTYDILGPTGTSLGYASVAAKAGDSVALFGNGFGPTNPAVPPGQPFSGAAATTNPVTLRINNVSLTPTFAGLSGAGLYQVNLTIPAGLSTGDVSLQAAVGGVQTLSGVVISLQ